MSFHYPTLTKPVDSGSPRGIGEDTSSHNQDGATKKTESLYPSLYPEVPKYTPVTFYAFQYAPIEAKKTPVTLDEEESLRVTPYVQPTPARSGLSTLFGSLFGPATVESRLSSKKLIRWGKEHYPRQDAFIRHAKAHYGTRAVIINPKSMSKGSLLKLNYIKRQLDDQAANYHHVLSQVVDALGSEVADLSIEEQMPYYEGAIEEIGALFQKTMGKQRQVTRDLRGLFLNRMIQQVATEARENSTPLSRIHQIVRQRLLPFARTGDPQNPFAPVYFRGGFEELIYTEDPLSTFDMRRHYQRPSFGHAQRFTEQMIHAEVTRMSADPRLSQALATDPVQLQEQLSLEIAKIKNEEVPVDLEVWSQEVRVLHEALALQEAPSPLMTEFRSIESNLSLGYSLLRSKLDAAKSGATLDEGLVREYDAGFKTVRAYFEAVQGILGESVQPYSPSQVERAMRFDLTRELSELAEIQRDGIEEL